MTVTITKRVTLCVHLKAIHLLPPRAFLTWVVIVDGEAHAGEAEKVLELDDRLDVNYDFVFEHGVKKEDGAQQLLRLVTDAEKKTPT